MCFAICELLPCTGGKSIVSAFQTDTITFDIIPATLSLFRNDIKCSPAQNICGFAIGFGMPKQYSVVIN